MNYSRSLQESLNGAMIYRTQSLMEKTDKVIGRETFMRLAQDEVRELADELHAPDIAKDSRKIMDETADILVFANAAQTARGLDIYSPLENISQVVPKDDSSGAIEKLQSIIDDVTTRPELFYILVQQLIAVTTPYAAQGRNLFDSLGATLRKVLDNRPAEIYTTFSNQKQRELNDRERMEKYVYLEAATRLIRNRCGNRMKPIHWQPILPFFDDFENAQKNLQNLKTALEMMSVEDFTKRGWQAAAENSHIWKTLNGVITESAAGILRFRQ